MNRLFKIIATIIVLIVLIIIIGIAGLILFINPNHFKPLIIKQVEQETGRHLSIPGKLGWSFFPTISITTGELSLSNPKGFDQHAFLQVDSAKAEVRLFPLIAGKVVPKTIDLKGLKLHLIRKHSGQTNWQFSSNNKATSTETKPTPHHAPVSTAHEATDLPNNINLPNIDISDANISYTDQLTGKQITIQNLNLQAEQAKLGRPFPLEFSTHFASKNPNIKGNLNVNATITVGKQKQTLNLNNLTVNANIASTQTKGRMLPILLNGDVAINTDNHSITVKPMSGQIANLNFQGYMNILKNTPNNTDFKGALNVTPYNLQAFLISIGQAPIATQDANALHSVGFNATFSGNNNALTIALIKGTLDQTMLSGSINLTNLKKRTGKFNLNLDHLNLDRYQLTSNTKNSSNPSTQRQSAPQTIVYPTILKTLQITGILHAKDLTVSKLHFDHVETQLVTNRGNINLNPIKAELYHGTLHGSLDLNLQPLKPAYQIAANVNKLNMTPLFDDLLNMDTVQGTLSFDTHLNTLGNTVLDLKQNLNGQANVTIKNAVLKKIDIDHYYKMGIALLNGEKPNLNGGNHETNIGTLTALFNIDKGIARNDNLKLESHEFEITGNGIINLVNNAIHYRVKVDDRKHTPIPLQITGTLTSPNIGIDQSAIGDVVRHKAEKHIRNELQKKLSEHLGKLF